MKQNKIKIGSNRSFGIVFFVVFLIISIWPLLDEKELRYWPLIVSIIFLILGILKSNILTPLYKLIVYIMSFASHFLLYNLEKIFTI